MNKLDMESKDIVETNIKKLGELFPNCFTEGKINIDKLKQELSTEEIDETKEKYELTWPGKRQAICEGNKKINKTLVPLKEKSVDFDKTENIYIEGDNLEALKILQESYLNRVKLIYIDPPYNTGNDFIYNDKFERDNDIELIESGIIDENGNRLVTNSQSNGRFHSDWLSMMYPRLKLARNLLSDDGIILISIDDNEHDNLKKICDEIFGERSFVANIIWEKADSPRMDSKTLSSKHDFLLLYCKNIEAVNILKKSTDEIPEHYDKEDETGRKYYLKPLRYMGNGDAREDRPNLFYSLIAPDGTEVFPIRTDGSYGRWRWSKEKYNESKDRIEFIKGRNGWTVYTRIYADNMEGTPFETIWYNKEVGSNRTAMSDLKELFGGEKPFPTPKPVGLIKRALSLIDTKNSIILDFFGGSGTTAQAVMLQNVEDGGNRKYIVIQLQEKFQTADIDKAPKYSTICDIGEERIRRAGKKIKEETNANIDYGFRVYKVDTSNMKDVYYKPSEINQMNLLDYMSNIKEDRTPIDLLTQVMLDLGLTLDLKIEEKEILSNKVYYVEDNSLVACFDDQVDINIIDEICKCNPMKIVFKDISFKTDKDKINLEERIKKLSPDTEVSVL